MLEKANEKIPLEAFSFIFFIRLLTSICVLRLVMSSCFDIDDVSDAGRGGCCISRNSTLSCARSALVVTRRPILPVPLASLRTVMPHG